MRTSREDEVIRRLARSNVPLTVDAVRHRVGLSSWEATKVILLELFAEGKINGVKTSRGWIFWIKKETNPPKGGWEECHVSNV